MPDLEFVNRDILEDVHAESLRRFGGSAGVRDEGGILSALGAAENTYFYGNGDLYDIAAAYAFHVAEAQGFVDGNKRSAIGVALTFLGLNGIDGATDRGNDMRLYDAMIAIAEKRLDKPGLAALFRELFA